jgi:hypothetical protein
MNIDIKVEIGATIFTTTSSAYRKVYFECKERRLFRWDKIDCPWNNTPDTPMNDDGSSTGSSHGVDEVAFQKIIDAKIEEYTNMLLTGRPKIIMVDGKYPREEW